MTTDLAIFLATSGHSGVDRVFRNLVPELARRGLRLDLLAIRGHGPHYGELPAGVRRIALDAGHVNPALPALVRYLRRERPQVLLTDKDRVNRVALIARWLARVPTRVGVRLGTTPSVNLANRGAVERGVQIASMRALYRLADAVLVPSRGAAADLAALARLPPALVRVVPSPIVGPALHALAAEPAGHPWFADAGERPLVGVGELSERKDFATLVRAFARLHADRPGARLVILGEGRRRAELEQLARALGIADAVSLPGFVTNPYAYLARAAGFALSSRWEGMPVALLEALSLGVPSVACDCPSGPREVLADGRYGPLVPVGDDAALATALGELLDRPLPKAMLQEAARPYTVEASASAYLAALGLEAPA
jgi:glycosyltransferase involved in cell wall biosynthesis